MCVKTKCWYNASFAQACMFMIGTAAQMSNEAHFPFLALPYTCTGIW